MLPDRDDNQVRVSSKVIPIDSFLARKHQEEMENDLTGWKMKPLDMLDELLELAVSSDDYRMAARIVKTREIVFQTLIHYGHLIDHLMQRLEHAETLNEAFRAEIAKLQKSGR